MSSADQHELEGRERRYDRLTALVVVGAADVVVGAAEVVVGAAEVVVGAAEVVVGAAEVVVGDADVGDAEVSSRVALVAVVGTTCRRAER